jgi:rhamnogalacturonyl hydrolase YesR
MVKKNLLLMLFIVSHSVFAAEGKSTLKEWGEQTLDQIQKSFLMPDGKLYYLEINTTEKPHPCWIWDASIQLQALSTAARMEPGKYLPIVNRYATALGSYQTMYHGRPGFDVNPPPKPSDRYYDDNAWMAWAFLEAYEVTHDRQHLELALVAYNFAISGEDDKLGGGIYWHEDKTETKNTCSSGPTMVASLMLYKITGERRYLATAKRLYEWTRSRMQDSDGLIFDHITVPEGKVQGAKVSYNCGTMIKAACMLYEITNDKKYLDEAERMAKASEARFVDQASGEIGGWGKLNVKLIEAFLAMNEVDDDSHWLTVVGKALEIEHSHRNSAGWYALDWGKGPLEAKEPVRLIDQSAPARGYWIAAERGVVADVRN